MFDQIWSAVVNALLAIPPIRFIMGLVESQWRPLWATLWIAVIVYLISRTMHYLARRRAQLRILSESFGADPVPVPPPPRDGQPVDEVPSGQAILPVAAALPDPPRPAPEAAQSGRRTPSVPLPIVAAAFIVGAIVVANVALFLRPTPNDSADRPASAVPPAPGSDTRTDAPIDIRLKSGRMDDNDNCVGTFEVTRGSGTPARLVAFAMDTSGAIIARDSAQMASAVTGMFVDFRFRHVDCDEIDDWQIQATTPATRP